MPSARCLCGTGRPFADCCGPLLDGTTTAATAERLMRSRYTAFAVGDPAHLLATWHSRTRPASLELDPGVRWTGLDILAASGGSLLMAEGIVEFRAHYRTDHGAGSQHERSRFGREDGQWRYLDGISLP